MENSKVLIEDVDQEYDVSQDDIQIYAKQIGIDVIKEPHLMWIAEEGLSAKVPEPWLICSDEIDRVYYFNPETSDISWQHPSDKHYAYLVSEERTKSKSLNSASSDYGFESKLSSLADAPPLSSSGKNSPLPFKPGKKGGSLSARKLEFGHIENRRGAQLAPVVRLNTLKMPVASVSKSSGGTSFMPKGSYLTKNIRPVKEERNPNSQHEQELDYENPPLDDSNESLNSDDGSKYSYEETDDEKQIGVHEQFDMLDASQLSPMHSADESPDALEINSLVQFGAKIPPRLDSGLKKETIESIYNKENSPSLSLRKVGQPTFLKPITLTAKKKNANKSSKANKKVKNKNLAGLESCLNDNISMINNEQHIMLDQIQKEWIAMQDELERKEKEKYEKMLKDSTQKLEEEEMKLKKENSEKIAAIKKDFQKKIEEEEHAMKTSLQALKQSNKQKVFEEENKLQKELEILSESLQNEIKDMEEKNELELTRRKKELEESSFKELSNLESVLESNKKDIQEAHASEISNIQQAHEQRIKEMKSAHDKENKIISSESQEESVQREKGKLQELMKDEAEKYQDLLKEKETILSEISSQKCSFEELKNEMSKAQLKVEELQDEIKETENDLELLRSEKSGLISELSILKENISRQKSNLSNSEKKLKASFQDANCPRELSEAGTNTDLSFNDLVSKAVQVSVSCHDASSQMKNVSHLMLDATCQTKVNQTFADKSLQTVPVSSLDDKMDKEINKGGMHLDDATLDKTLENALSGLGIKLDSRINVIENQLRLLQENLSSRPVAQHANDPSQQFVQNEYSQPKPPSNAENRTLPPSHFTNGSISFGQFSDTFNVTSQSKCKCELGDPASCSILQDVKNSVYRFNDILCASFVPPLGTSTFCQLNQPLNNYSSPFNNFYAQLRQMQERQRLADIKHKCQDSAIKFTKDASSNLRDAKNFGRFNSTKSSYHLPCHPTILHSDAYLHNESEDPLIRARSVILREKARTWKEQHVLQSSASHMFSMNSPSEVSQSLVTDFTSPYNVPSSEQPFYNFEVDPETDFNMWMTRLNALQLRIRSHKML